MSHTIRERSARFRRFRYKLVLLGSVSVMLSPPGSLEAVQWTNTTNGHYLAGSSWAGGAVPASNQGAEFNAFGGSPVLWGNGNTTSASLNVSQNDFIFTGCCGAVGIPFTHTVTGNTIIESNGSLALG